MPNNAVGETFIGTLVLFLSMVFEELRKKDDAALFIIRRTEVAQDLDPSLAETEYRGEEVEIVSPRPAALYCPPKGLWQYNRKRVEVEPGYYVVGAQP